MSDFDDASPENDGRQLDAGIEKIMTVLRAPELAANPHCFVMGDASGGAVLRPVARS